MLKTYTVTKTKFSNNQVIKFKGTIGELLETFSYTLECGASYQHEKGNKKINRAPKTIKSLISNLNNAVNNSAQNGYAGVTFTSED